MTTNGTMRLRRSLTLAAVLALLATFSLIPTIKAATTGDVEVTADIAPTLTMTLCDQTADFGSGLDASGDPATVAGEMITAIPQTPGSPDGAYYRWDPNCASGQNFLTVTSNVSWQSTVCATLLSNPSAMTLSDLRYTANTALQTYAGIDTNALPFPDCSSSSQVWTSGSPGATGKDAFYYLKVDPGDGAGSFSATTTVEVTGS